MRHDGKGGDANSNDANGDGGDAGASGDADAESAPAATARPFARQRPFGIVQGRIALLAADPTVPRNPLAGATLASPLLGEISSPDFPPHWVKHESGGRVALLFAACRGTLPRRAGAFAARAQPGIVVNSMRNTLPGHESSVNPAASNRSHSWRGLRTSQLTGAGCYPASTGYRDSIKTLDSVFPSVENSARKPKGDAML